MVTDNKKKIKWIRLEPPIELHRRLKMRQAEHQLKTGDRISLADLALQLVEEGLK